MPLPIVGILLGGQARRMGGFPKGNLVVDVVDGRTILERTLAAVRSAATSVAEPLSVYLVGQGSAYSASDVQRLEDEPRGVGPMGGLSALLQRAEGAEVVAIAGDLPFLTRELVERVFFECNGAAALAPREGERWQPLFARYSAGAVLPIVRAALGRGDTSLQVIFASLGGEARVLDLSDAERACLIDWDRPSDVNLRCPESSP